MVYALLCVLIHVYSMPLGYDRILSRMSSKE